jgi:catechol 2,3-dioxygenase-like lactoylglutathione lyase family enzyme
VSYLAVATDRFEKMVWFYSEILGFPIAAEWDRDRGRGKCFNLGQLRLEILDNTRERRALPLGEPADRFHIVVEVEDIEAVRDSIAIPAPPTQATSWGARLFVLRDPDGVPVTFLQWTSRGNPNGA